MRKDTFEQDKQRVLELFMKYALGVRNARTREDILPFIQMRDRPFRYIASELIHEGHMASTASKGYWAIPLHTNDPREIEAIKHSYLERKSKALSMLEDVNRQLDELEKRVGQKELNFA